MKTSFSNIADRKAPKTKLGKPALLLAMMSCFRLASAQTVISPSGISSPSPSSSTISSPAMDMRTNQGFWTNSVATPAGLKLGPFTEHPHFFYRLLYGDGIQASPGIASNTTINSFSPGLLTEFGSHWTLDYTPTWNFYSSKAFRDTVDQSFSLNFNTAYQEWTIGFFHKFDVTTSPLVETGAQTRQQSHLTQLDTAYQYASGFLLETVATQSVRLVEGFNDTREWTLLEYLHYQVTPQLSSAVGLSFSYDKASKSPDSTLYQILTRLGWHPYFPMSFELEAGLEDRKIQQDGATSTVNPVLNVSVRYQPIAPTAFSLHAGRSTQLSAIENQVLETNRIGLTVEQRLLAQFQLSAGIDYEKMDYRLSGADALQSRSDKNISFNARLGTTLFRRLTSAISYVKNHNTSSRQGFGFSSSQIGVELGYKY